MVLAAAMAAGQLAAATALAGGRWRSPSARSPRSWSGAAATTTRCFRPSSCRWPGAPEHARPSHRARDVLAQPVRLALNFLETLLDHVADADHAAQPAVTLGHRNVPDAPLGHQRH